MEIYALKVRPRSHPFPILAWTIMSLQKMPPWKTYAYSHQAIMFKRNNKFYVIDSTSKGVRVQSDIKFFEFYKMVDCKKLKNISEEDFENWKYSIIGREYDKSQLLGFIPAILFNKGDNKKGKNFKKMICSEVILHFLKTFENIYIHDSDDFDLKMTWELIPQLNWRQ